MDYGFDAGGDCLTVVLDGRMTHADYKGFREILARVNQDKPGKEAYRDAPGND